MRENIMQHFEQYSGIQSIDFCSDETCAFLKFKNASSAKAVMKQAKHIVDDAIITIKAVHELIQPTIDDPLHMPFDEGSPLHISNSISCSEILINIFERLSLMDLCAAAEVCKKFKAIADYTFSKIFPV